MPRNRSQEAAGVGHSPFLLTGWRNEVLPLSIVLALAALFFFTWFNRFGGIRSGDGEFSGGIAFLANRLPYRDYYTAGPPVNQLKSALELALFGKTLFVTRFCAVLERLVIAAVLYAWLRKSFSRMAAAVASLATIIISAGDRTDPLASYNHDAIFFAMLCGFAASLALSSDRTRTFFAWSVAAGAASALSSLTKQTVGLGTMVAVLLITAAACLSLFGLRRAGLWCGAYLAGFAAPVLLVGAYLRHLGVLHAALQMLFVSGPAAKAGHSSVFLTREWSVAVDNFPFVFLALIALAMSARPVWKSVRSQTSSPSNRWARFALAGFVVIAAPIALAFTHRGAINNFSKCAVYYALLGTALVGLAAIVCALRKTGDTARFWQIALLAAVGWSVAVTLSLSWPAFEAMTLPGLGLLLAAAVDGITAHPRTLYSLIAITVFLQIREKLNLPFSFDRQFEPAIRFATQSSALPALRGMRLPSETVRLFDESTTLMQSTPPTDTVFTYPEMSVFYALSGRNPPTWAGSHNIDVVSDPFARQEAARLLAARPRVLLYARPTEAQLQNDETIWREGRRSGQRALVAAMDCLVSQYQLIDTFRLTPADNPIRLYLRPASLPAGQTQPGPASNVVPAGLADDPCPAAASSSGVPSQR